MELQEESGGANLRSGTCRFERRPLLPNRPFSIATAASLHPSTPPSALYTALPASSLYSPPPTRSFSRPVFPPVPPGVVSLFPALFPLQSLFWHTVPIILSRICNHIPLQPPRAFVSPARSRYFRKMAYKVWTYATQPDETGGAALARAWGIKVNLMYRDEVRQRQIMARTDELGAALWAGFSLRQVAQKVGLGSARCVERYGAVRPLPGRVRRPSCVQQSPTSRHASRKGHLGDPLVEDAESTGLRPILTRKGVTAVAVRARFPLEP